MVRCPRRCSRCMVIQLSFLVAALFVLNLLNLQSLSIERVSSAFQKSPHTKFRLIQIVSPYVSTNEGGDFYPLDLNQWAAMESIRRSLQRAPTTLLEVDLICAVSSSEQSILVHAGLPCHRYLVLNRSTHTEYPGLQPHLELPFISDMVDGIIPPLGNTTFHVILMNADIGLSKDFYRSLVTVLKKHDAFSINRMTISMEEIQPTTNSTDLLENQVDRLIGQGTRHPGYDFFCISSALIQRISFGSFFLGRPPWGANVHLMLQIMADHYINIKSSPLGTFHLGNDSSRWKKAWSDSLPSDAPGSILQAFCPSKNLQSFDALAIQNEENCGRWFLGDYTPIDNSSQYTESQPFVPDFVGSGFEHIFWDRYEKYLKFDTRGVPQGRMYETPKRKRRPDGPFTRNKKGRIPKDPLQHLLF